jgi:hypothetical protein
VALSEQGLQTLSSTLDQPIYWAGPERGTTYELTQAAGHRIYVRYLPPRIPVGSTKTFLTVGTYPMAGAYAVTSGVAREAGSVRIAGGGGAVAFYRRSVPTSVYLAYPGSDYQLEVFDPVAARAQQLVASGAIQTVIPHVVVPALPKTRTAAVSAVELKALSAQLGHPIYWLGQQHGSTYELSQTAGGRVYLRYLPAGVALGVDRPYLTVGTYPMTGAFATTEAAARQHGVVTIPVPGGVAFYSQARPTSVYVAFPGVNEQIEVFDPSSALVHQVVAALQVRAVS